MNATPMESPLMKAFGVKGLKGDMVGQASAHEDASRRKPNPSGSDKSKLRKVVVRPSGKDAATAYDGLPGAVSMPDGKVPVSLGSGRITSLLSKGGMAMIYEIWNPTLEVKRAVKLLRPDHTEDSAQRFETEMKISAKLHHPNIVEIYAVGKWRDLPYIEMEEIDGATVEKLIAESGCLPVEVCTSIAIMVGRALNYAHNQKCVIYGREYHGVIHRDLKPSNVMVTRQGVVKLMDFGIAKPTTASLVTCGNVVVGTLQYLSPEQLEGKDIDVRADIYSLAVVLYEMLTGKKAFPQDQLAMLVPNKLGSRYVPLDDYCIKIPRALRQLIHQCLHHAKEKRVANALDFLRVLGRIHKDITDNSPEQVLARYMVKPRRSRVRVEMRIRRRIMPAAAIVIVGVVVIASSIVPFLVPTFGSYLKETWGNINDKPFVDENVFQLAGRPSKNHANDTVEMNSGNNAEPSEAAEKALRLPEKVPKNNEVEQTPKKPPPSPQLGKKVTSK
ncbi:MAG: protein kinase, partial [Chitinivibrionales bacterium]|nr:protein kinase [Chitinivibrionales bacterium]MBD3355829.1 protein kinase [Chitinivibrionales bacterium]